jgi:hypothetical protein
MAGTKTAAVTIRDINSGTRFANERLMANLQFLCENRSQKISSIPCWTC